jgi:hypothetical protein
VQERLNSFAERPWILLPVAALGYLWIVLGKQNEKKPFPLVTDVLIGVILSTWATFILRSFGL